MKITDEMLYRHAAEARDIWLDTLPNDDELPNHQVFHPLCNVCVCQILATGFRQSVIFTSSNFLHHGIAPLASKKSQILHDVFVLPYLLVAHR